ncbi:MAG TPA: c-type cytochrome [Gammaproteobacteria bacterium]|nr:c-type cytochrome [Gammaproteobacteria bacterium]
MKLASLLSHCVWVCVPLILWNAANADTHQNLQLVGPGTQKTISLAELRKNLKTVSVTLDDPVYQKEKTFDGFELQEVLGLLGPSTEGVDEIVFQSTDGYAPSLPMSKALAHGAILAYQEHGNPRKWDKIRQGKAWLSPAPFYLVWKEGKELGEEFPWPYQLIKIELVKFSSKFAKLYPAEAKNDSAVMRGFVDFKTNCMRCHSINLEGGDLAPELNIPQNVTEYWSRDTLKNFIANPGAFRAKSKMPPFEDVLKSGGIDDILEYLDYMKVHKSR